MEIVSTPLNKVVSWTYPSQFCWFLKQIGSCNNKIPCRGIQHNFLIPKNRDPQLKQTVSSSRKDKSCSFLPGKRIQQLLRWSFWGDKFCPSLPCGIQSRHFAHLWRHVKIMCFWCDHGGAGLNRGGILTAVISLSSKSGETRHWRCGSFCTSDW